MKKDICECGGCHKTAAVKLRNGHKICEDCAKSFRQLKKAGKKPRYFFKEVLVGHFGDPKDHIDLCVVRSIKL